MLLHHSEGQVLSTTDLWVDMKVGTHGTANQSKGHTVAVESQRHFLTKGFHKRNASDMFPVAAICWEVAY